MPAAILEQPRLERSRTSAQATARAHHQWEWLLAGLVLAFALPYVLTDLVTINRDLYYGIYAFSVYGFFALWLRFAVETPRALLTRNWRWGAPRCSSPPSTTSAIPSPHANHAQPDRRAARPRRPACQRRRSRLQHRHLPAAAHQRSPLSERRTR